MRISEGVPDGRTVELYHPEMFQEREEVIVFIREDFNRTYTSITNQISYINKIDLHLDRSEEWKLIGHWPKIMQSVHRIDLNMDLLFQKEPKQSYLDAYLYQDIRSPQNNVEVSENEGITEIKDYKANLLY